MLGTAPPVWDGYGKVAELMSTYDEFAILRRFKRLNMKSLLYLQAEIAHMEEALDDQVERDSVDPALQYHGRDWWSLANDDNKSSQEHWHKVLQLREKLDLYNDACLRQARLARLDGPSRQDLQFLRAWMERPRMGNFPLLGLDRRTWDEEHEDDLLAIRARPAAGVFSAWVLETLVPLFHRFVGERFKVCDDTSLRGICSRYKKCSFPYFLAFGLNSAPHNHSGVLI
jgi:hypothetical protein